MKWKLTFCFVLFTLISFSKDIEQYYQSKIAQAKHDTIKVKLLFDWDDEIYLGNPSLDLKLNNQIISFVKGKLKLKNVSKKERVFYFYALARSLNNKGLILSEQNKLNDALTYLTESYQIAKKYHFKLTESHTTNNLGTIYRSLQEHKKAITFYEKSLNITKDSLLTPETFNNIGLCYSDLKDTAKALVYFNLSLKYSDDSYHALNIANTLLNLADLYLEKKDQKSAFIYFNKALEKNKQINNYHGIAYSYEKLSNLLRIQKKYKQALTFAHEAFSISSQNDLLYNKQEATNCLYKIFKDLNNSDSSLYYFELYIKFSKEYDKQTNREELIKKEYFFEYKNKEKIEQTKHKKEMEIASEKNKRQKVILIFVVITFVGFLVFLYFVIKSYRKTRKMNALIESQKREVEIKNTEILDSISYAKRIQTAILPTDEYFKSKFRESFILYLPKDIVAGDFYWMEEKDNLLIFAVADCTGHGVPGAMVSVVCHNALNRCIREFDLSEPNEILNKTRELIIHEFEKSNEEMKDGMDISLCCLDTDMLQLKWAGANNPLWVIRKNSNSENELVEFKADKQPIGNYSHAKAFSLHEYQLQKGDVIYLFSDGFIDQFGGETSDFTNGKKYKSKRFKALLLDIAQDDIEKQKTILKNDFLKWKGNLEQVDDICIVGIRV